MHLVTTCMTLLLFAWSIHGQDYHSGQYTSSTALYGVTYSPFALDLQSICLPPSQVERDMTLIKGVTDHVRMYNLASCPENLQVILRFCEENGMRVMLGLYLSNSTANNDREMAALGPLLESYGEIIDAVIVGNEVVFLKQLTVEALVIYIQKAKDLVADYGYDIPVTTAEVWPIYESVVGPALVDACDFICMNMSAFSTSKVCLCTRDCRQPYWEGWDVICPVDVEYICASAGDYVHRKANGLEGYFRKPVWICESGWPTEGERCCQGRPNARDGLRVMLFSNP